MIKEGQVRSMAGRPPKYKSKEELEARIEKYFKDCKGEILRDENGSPVLDKYGMPIVVDSRPPTITGLALALGFASRQALLNYQAKKQFNDTITRAKARVEQYAEERLFDRDGSHGAQFSLRNNFKGWKETEGENEDALKKLDDVLKEIKGAV